jgi:glutamate-1-semialdehyde 2,1-aminomutase
LIQRKEFLQKIKKLSEDFNIPLLFDEVISGFRVGFQGMAGDLGIEPDLVCYGKILGAGFPVGAYAGKAKYMDLVSPIGPVYQAGTLSGNPFGMRAGLKNLQKAYTENPYTILKNSNQYFTKEMITLLNKYNSYDNMEWEAITKASLFWIKQKTEKPVRNISSIPEGHKSRFAKVFHALLKAGVYLAPSGYEVGFLSTQHTDSILKETLNRIESGLKQDFLK